MIAPVCMFKRIFRVPLCVVTSSTEHHERVAGQFVQNAHQITILEQVGSPLHKSNKPQLLLDYLILAWNEDVTLV